MVSGIFERYLRRPSRRRLAKVVSGCPDDFTFHYRNTTPLTAADPTSILPTDSEYVQAFLKRLDPELIVACGKSAGEHFRGIDTERKILYMHHPAYRVVTNRYLEAVAAMIVDCAAGRWNSLQVELTQMRGSVVSAALC